MFCNVPLGLGSNQKGSGLRRLQAPEREAPQPVAKCLQKLADAIEILKWTDPETRSRSREALARPPYNSSRGHVACWMSLRLGIKTPTQVQALVRSLEAGE